MSTKAYCLNRNKFLDELELRELNRILKKCDKTERNALMIRLALATGARAQEILNIRRQDLFDADKSVFIIGLKGSNDREIPLPIDLYKSVQRYLKNHQGEFLFPICYVQLNRIWQFYRPCKKTFHALRHTFAVELYKKHKDIRLLQMALGHKNIKNTEIYVTFEYTTNQMRRLLCR